MDSNLKSAFIGRIGATICSIAFMALTAKYGITLSPDDQQTITDMVIMGLQGISGLGAMILPLISKIREGKRQ